MKRRTLKKLAVFFVAAVFALVAGLTFAADKYVVIKDKKGVCKVIRAKKDKTPATIAGPYATKAEAQKAKEEKCPKKKKEPAKKKQ